MIGAALRANTAPRCANELWQGNFIAAREHFERGLSFYNADEHSALATVYSYDPGTGTLSYLAMDLWFLGYPDQAIERARASVAQAKAMGHASSYLHNLVRALQVALLREEGGIVLEDIQSVLTSQLRLDAHRRGADQRTARFIVHALKDEVVGARVEPAPCLHVRHSRGRISPRSGGSAEYPGLDKRDLISGQLTGRRPVPHGVRCDGHGALVRYDEPMLADQPLVERERAREVRDRLQYFAHSRIVVID